MPIVLLFGPPGCGKGTQAAHIARRYAIPAISTGELFRAECQAGTPLGLEVSAIVAQGGLVGDEIVNRIVSNRISRTDCAAGFVLDGFPRTLPQASFLDYVLRNRGFPRAWVIHLEVSPEVLVRRLSARRQCPACGRIYNLLWRPPSNREVCDDDGAALIRRPDDAESIILERLRAYEELTAPVIAHYRRARYYPVDGDRPAEEIQLEIHGLLTAGPRRSRASRRIPNTVGAVSTPA